MTRHLTDEAASTNLDLWKCVEDGVWVPIPREPPPGPLMLRLKDVDPDESAAVKRNGVMTFHMTGCSGHFGHPHPQTEVAAAMARQIAEPHCFGGTKHAVAPSFFYHLGDIVYKDQDKTDPERADQQKLFNEHFYTPYSRYGRNIFAIAGNHDGKDSKYPEKSAIRHFLQNFCDSARNPSPDGQAGGRLTMIQPYLYWLLKTPLAFFVGLYTNDINAGQLDNPAGPEQPQYDWLVQTLRAIRKAKDDRAVFVAVHYPPYSAAANFQQRGDPNLGPTRWGRKLRPIGMILEEAFQESEQYPDAVFSAHAHLYQRITYTQRS
jgi:acid phosphatase type 7